MTLSRLFQLARLALLPTSLLAVAQAALALPQVRFATSAGDFVVELYPDKAPRTVENFLQYVKDKHYDGTLFHRVIPNFMVQGGGFDAKYVQKPTRAPVVHERPASPVPPTTRPAATPGPPA